MVMEVNTAKIMVRTWGGRQTEQSKRATVITEERKDTGFSPRISPGKHLPCIETFEEQMMARVLLVQEQCWIQDNKTNSKQSVVIFFLCYNK